ncbi:hypothetical protein EJ08DRAFT_47823 [Tothia fuscella]|uniref:Uncharacterized protein n=1 Tax=Tothia fuscella TaxID=1048955 RepID=A0A9P4TT03_9PEZI|nr:hypothetical protein EJ08DRAFT_47823 [Tothia fuscella]
MKQKDFSSPPFPPKGYGTRNIVQQQSAQPEHTSNVTSQNDVVRQPVERLYTHQSAFDGGLEDSHLEFDDIENFDPIDNDPDAVEKYFLGSPQQTELLTGSGKGKGRMQSPLPPSSRQRTTSLETHRTARTVYTRRGAHGSRKALKTVGKSKQTAKPSHHMEETIRSVSGPSGSEHSSPLRPVAKKRRTQDLPQYRTHHSPDEEHEYAYIEPPSPSRATTRLQRRDGLSGASTSSSKRPTRLPASNDSSSSRVVRPRESTDSSRAEHGQMTARTPSQTHSRTSSTTRPPPAVPRRGRPPSSNLEIGLEAALKLPIFLLVPMNDDNDKLIALEKVQNSTTIAEIREEIERSLRRPLQQNGWMASFSRTTLSRCYSSYTIQNKDSDWPEGRAKRGVCKKCYDNLRACLFLISNYFDSLFFPSISTRNTFGRTGVTGFFLPPRSSNELSYNTSDCTAPFIGCAPKSGACLLGSPPVVFTGHENRSMTTSSHLYQRMM